MSRPVLIDLYCGQGGAGMGYHLAGFDVIGVDINPQPRYPFTFVQMDVLDFLEVNWGKIRKDSPAIHASPPCQDHSPLGKQQGEHGTGWLLDATRTALVDLGVPYVIENVNGARMVDPTVLCGSMFGLGTRCNDGVYRQIRRHRKFESNIPLDVPPRCHHVGQPIGVYGTGGGGQMTRGYKGDRAESLAAIGAPWMDRKGVSQSIPPAYANWVGLQLMAAQQRKAA